MKPKIPLWKLAWHALLEWIEEKIPFRWKYQLLRRWLTTELISDGWTQDGDEKKRLCNESTQQDYLGSHTRISMADHEAIGRHFKKYPLR